jgi:hypothetical protein
VVVYNVTVKVALADHVEWLKWMRTEHLPDVLETGLFSDHKLMRLLDQDESDGITYCVQLTCKTTKDYERYARDHAPRLRQDHAERFPDNVSFRSLLEEV